MPARWSRWCRHEQEQEQDTDLRDGIDHALERWCVWKDHTADFRDERSEYGGAKNHAGQQLAEDGRLPEATHPLAKHAANEEQED